MDFKKIKEFNIDDIQNFEDSLKDSINIIAKSRTNAMEEAVIRFLKEKGFRPKKSVKYFNYIKKKLEKQDLAIRIHIYVKRDSDYSWTETVIPEFAKVSEMKRKNDFELFKRHIIGGIYE